jgi:anti-sigma-K factor RskA
MLQRCLSLRSAVAAVAALAALLCGTALQASAQQNGDKPFHALVTDAKDMQTDLKNVRVLLGREGQRDLVHSA